MKAKPVILIPGEGYKNCDAERATHLQIKIPSHNFPLNLPVITKGTREGTGCWTWNGCTEKPTLRPSVLTTNHEFRCHSWITDGEVHYLSDCSHYMAGKTEELKEI
jgi:hypothetical protein